MLTLILGRAKTGKTTELLRRVQSCPTTAMASRIIIVPDQLSHQTERNLSRMCGDEISFVSEVLSFTRLGSRVFSLYGGGARKTLDNAGRLLTADLALTGIRPRLKVFASSAGRAEFLSSMVSMIDELKTYCVTSKELSAAADRSTGLFSEKLRELALILDAYNASVAQGDLDPRDKMTLLHQKLLEGDYAKGRHFFVDGFTDFSRQDMDILRVLLQQSEHMTVSILCDGLNSPDPLFDPGRETAQALLEMAKSLGQDTEIVTLSASREVPEDLAYLEKHLLSYTAAPFPGDSRGIHISSASDRLAECRWCAEEIRKLVRNGLRWRDIAICTPVPSDYQTTLELVFSSADIPLYTGTKTLVTANPAVRFFLLGLECAVENMETEAVSAYLKTGYSGLSEDLIDAIENYAITWAIRGSKWFSPWTQHPDGYDGKFTDALREELQLLSQKKDAALLPLKNLSASLKSAGNVLGQMQAIHRYMEETELYEKLNAELVALTEQGRLELAQETAQIYEILVSCLEQVTSVLGDLKLSGRELYKMISLALSQYEVGTIPATLDYVNFGDISSSRGLVPKVLFLLGANEGTLPASGTGNSLLTERERGILEQEYEIKLAPDNEGAMERQMLQIYSAFTAPGQSLYVSYPLESNGDALLPSYLVGRIQKLFPNTESVSVSDETILTASDAAQSYLLSVGDPDRAAIMAAILRAAEEVEVLGSEITQAQRASESRAMDVSQDSAEKIFGSPVRLTASKLDAYGNCPLSFFLEYGLKARIRKEATFDAAEFGTFVHHVLEKAVAELSLGDMSMTISEEESKELVAHYMEGYLEERTGGEITSRDAYLFQRNSQETTLLLREISQEFSDSDFRPVGFEQKFGKGRDALPVLVSGKLGRGQLEGTVDRIDRYTCQEGDFLRVVDYKSGTKKFDYTELYGGVGMQMLLYLFALKKTGKWGDIPAGVLYFPAKRPFASESGPKEEDAGPVKRSGLVLGEELVLSAMEHGDQFQYLPAKRLKSKPGFGDYAVSRQQMDTLEGFVEQRMGEAVDHILSGDFAPKPFYRGPSHDPCNWCDYSEVCQKDSRFRKQHYRETLKASEFWDKLGGDGDGENDAD